MSVFRHIARPESAFVAKPDDCTDAARFPNIAAAIREHESLPAERRAALEAEWENRT